MRKTMLDSLLPLFRPFAAFLALFTFVFLVECPAQADAAGDKRRAQLAPVKRIVVLAPFFGTDMLMKAEAPPKPGEKPNPQMTQYVGYLKKIEVHVREWLPERVKVRTPFEVVSTEELGAALKDLKLTPEKLFQNNGRMRGSRFAAPDAAAVRQVASRLHADAVLLGTLDEPRRSNGKYTFDVLAGIGYDSPNVRCKAGYYLLLADATEVLFNPIEVLHPLTSLGKRDFVLADWLETEEQVIENFMDELTRYTPVKK